MVVYNYILKIICIYKQSFVKNFKKLYKNISESIPVKNDKSAKPTNKENKVTDENSVQGIQIHNFLYGIIYESLVNLFNN